jgi:hypothetical protein
MLAQCLKRKLVFGDEEQIAAVRSLEEESGEQEKIDQRIARGEIAWFEVEVEVEGSTIVRVLAENYLEAKKQAVENIDLDDIDNFDVRASFARQVV